MVIHDFDVTLDRTIVEDLLKTHLENNEVRVRISVANVLQAYAKIYGVSVWFKFQHDLIDIIQSNIERSDPDPEWILATRKQTTLRHDTEGWNSLDSAVQTIQRIVEGMSVGNGQNQFPLTIEFIELIYTLLKHKNRFVRDSTFRLIDSLFHGAVESLSIFPFAQKISEYLSNGLVDEWGHVVLAASLATRSLLILLKKEAQKNSMKSRLKTRDLIKIYTNQMKKNKSNEIENPNNNNSNFVFGQVVEILIPYLCLNRYTIQDGIRNYNIQTWKMLVFDEGPLLVSDFISTIVPVYIEQTQSLIEIQRESAVYCVGELFKKVQIDSADKKFQTSLLDSLKLSLIDHSWPIRDAACSSISNYINSNVCQQSEIDQIFAILKQRLFDNVRAIRESAALALSDLVLKYPTYYDSLLNFSLLTLPSVLNQPVDEHINPNVENIFGKSAKLARDNDPLLHVNQQIFSCECHASSHTCKSHFIRDPEPWEMTDGSIILITNLILKNVPSFLNQFVPILTSTLNNLNPTFNKHEILVSYIWLQMIKIIQTVGVEAFQPFWVSLINPCILSLKSQSKLSQVNSSNFIKELFKFYGKEKVEHYLTADEISLVNCIQKLAGKVETTVLFSHKFY